VVRGVEPFIASFNCCASGDALAAIETDRALLASNRCIMRLLPACWLLWLALFAIDSSAVSQPIAGGDLSYRSSGSGGSDWTLSENGYVGTYFTLAAPGTVTLTVEASGSTNDTVSPHMNLVVADTKAGFDVTGGFTNYGRTFELPAGTYFVRTEFNNDVPTANRQLTVRSLTISGATTVSNSTNTATNNANALSAADTYIQHFRRGSANVALVGLAAGTPVEVTMVRNAFNFGTMVQGFDANVFLAPVSPGDTTSIAARYQQFVNKHFNILVPSNMGKWQPNENVQNVPTLSHVDTILNYAQSHNMNVRMHNLIWGTQQPSWVNSLITSAQSSNPTVAAQAKANLITAITNRIAYYVGDADSDTSDGDRARKYIEIDVLNESLRDGTYWDIFGTEGVADIYKKVNDAVVAAGADTRLYTNEYNVLQFANNPNGGAPDAYANWYRRHVEDINNAGFGEVVTGIGVQYAVDARTSNTQVHSAARIQQVLQNLSVTGLPISLTEFSVSPNAGGVITTEQRSAEIYNETLRMSFGTPAATSFLIWEPWPSPTASTDNTTIVDANWNLRASGQALVDLLDAWTTPTQNLLVGPDGTIDFTGYYGDYEITIGSQTFDLSLLKGTQLYSLVVVPGDYNGDGTVNAADYVVWRDTIGSADDLRADGNGNLIIDSGDYDVWRARFCETAIADIGKMASLPTATTVPEPSAIWLLVLAAIISAIESRRDVDIGPKTPK
jgi:GH35 family endo-1,4-beta-xylanase